MMLSVSRVRMHGRCGMLATLACVLFLSPAGHAQGRGGGGREAGGGPRGAAGGGQNGMGPGSAGLGGRGGIPPSGGVRGGASGGNGGSSNVMQSRMAGRWWDDKNYSNALGLKPEQKKRMDAIFNGNRGELVDRMQTLRQEESRLEAATHDTRLSQESIFGQMDRVAVARDALEKVNTRMLESLRKELEPEQLTRMQALK